MRGKQENLVSNMSQKRFGSEKNYPNLLFLVCSRNIFVKLCNFMMFPIVFREKKIPRKLGLLGKKKRSLKRKI